LPEAECDTIAEAWKTDASQENKKEKKI